MNEKRHWFAWKLFRDEFRDWYGSISVLELSSNREIISGIQTIEKTLTEILSHG